MNKERLLKLADFLNTVPPEQFNFRYWCSLPKPCGFVGCAVGWATQIPEFKELGLCLERDEWDVIRPAFNGRWNLDAVESFFGLDRDEATYLFLPIAEGGTLGDSASAKGVAEHIRDFIEVGIRVEEDEDE